MEFKRAEAVHIREAVELAKREYEVERVSCPALIQKDFGEELEGLITALVNSKYSFVAIEGEKVVGFLGFWGGIDGFFGNCKGAFSPLGGSAFESDDRNKLASKLLSYAMQVMVEDGIASFALSRYAHDDEVGKGLVLNGFGIRCSDAIMDLKDMKAKEKFKISEDNSGIIFEELKKEEYWKIEEMQKGLTKHLSQAPTFFPTPLEFFEHQEEWLTKRMFVAKDHDKVIGFIEVKDDEGETFVSKETYMYNICGTYVNPDYRNGNIAQQILACVVHTMINEGVSYLGVDCETLNPNALRFWGKYFTPYTYSYHRRIDERVIGYQQYFDGYWEKKKAR